MTLEQKLEILARCGLSLAPPFRAEDLLASLPRKHYEEPGFEVVLSALGATEEAPPWRNYCARLWSFDTECIEGDGSYRRIAERMRDMAEGSLPIENIQDHVDSDEHEAWLAFTCRGQKFFINCQVEDDWVDPKVFAPFVKLLSQCDPTKIFLHHGFGGGGQDCLLACVTKAHFAELRRLGIGFQPLN